MLIPASRPGKATIGTSVKLHSNFFKFQLKTHGLQKYFVEFFPNIAQVTSSLRQRVIGKVASAVRQKIGSFVYDNTVVYASNEVSEEFSVETSYDETNYTVTFKPVGSAEDHLERFKFYNKFMKVVQSKLGMVPILRKLYDHQNGVIELDKHKLEIWPGYSTAVHEFEGGCMLNVDVAYRCIRTLTVFDMLKECKGNPRQEFEKLVTGSCVLTKYNKRCYRVEGVDFDKDPSFKFDVGGQEESFLSYYQRRWGVLIKNKDQPLLVSSLKEIGQIYLIPELCIMTGITDAMRSDFGLMKELSEKTKPLPKTRINNCRGLIRNLKSKQKTSEVMESWRVDIQENPTEVVAKVVEPGRVQTGQESFTINPLKGSFDTDIGTRQLFKHPGLKKWGIFYVKLDQRLVEAFKSTMQQALKTFRVSAAPPASFGLSTNNWDEWEARLREVLAPDVQFIICILPGSRGKSKLYDPLKSLLIRDFPVPSQVVLNNTLKRDRALRSVVNKVIIQIVAKIGGTPWLLENLPQSGTNTMVVGVEVFSKRSSHSVVGLCASLDPNFSQFCPVAELGHTTAAMNFTESMLKALETYYSVNQTYPQQVIIYREGISDSGRAEALQTEVPNYLNALETLLQQGKVPQRPKLLFLIINRRTNARFYTAEEVKNPPIGTCVDTQVVHPQGWDFYICPVTTNQGVASPTHCFVLYDDTGLSADQVQVLTYRLCYSYWNWCGSIRKPSPCQFAHKLAYHIGERSHPSAPHAHWSTTKSQFYL